MPEPYRDNPESDVENDESRYEAGRRRAQRMFDGFLDFALQGNILEIAFGLMYVSLHSRPQLYTTPLGSRCQGQLVWPIRGCVF